MTAQTHTHRPSFCIHVAYEGVITDLRSHASQLHRRTSVEIPACSLDLTCAAVDVIVKTRLDAGTGSVSNRRSADDNDDADRTDSKRVALQESGMQPDAQSHTRHDGVTLLVGDYSDLPGTAEAGNVDAYMGEATDE